MWALVKEKPEEGLWMKRVPIPEVGPNDVKIKIHKTAICGTDVHIYQWNDWAQHTIPIGLTAGHEYVGEIVEKGEGVQGFKIGDLVSADTAISFISPPPNPPFNRTVNTSIGTAMTTAPRHRSWTDTPTRNNISIQASVRIPICVHGSMI